MSALQLERELERDRVDLARVESRLRDVALRISSTNTVRLPFDAIRGSITRSLSGGKRIRPLLLLHTYRRLEEQRDGSRDTDSSSPETASGVIDIAAAFELLHAAFVAHDDVIDGDLKRRGDLNAVGEAVSLAVDHGVPPKAAARLGVTAGILSGDLLLGAAYSLVARAAVPTEVRSSLLDLVDRTLLDSAEGEYADVWFSIAPSHADPERVVVTSELKTARYSFQAPLLAAATLATSEPAVRDALDEIGAALGTVYQLRDDVLGVFGNPETTGKSALGDLREGKHTLLVELARSTDAWRGASDRFGKPDLDEVDAERLRGALRDSGALAQVESEIQRRVDSAARRIDEAPLPQELQTYLAHLLIRCAERTS
ncbi:polyprenyl synthetase family protein [Ruicaihuangia caeni]|uniref:Polyprenyl synthetase family protein n=1 Tax=Ruicaihuangia caeni TaxID=3042517 RepID=A0AAW6T5W1_9MICO|nr:polyprenyl synthetase family protein [Klugiella sp. YN-L-19]MDI2098864.1 polyprenyl synthetase family protein [Klugiella sp. YN-L-19]